MQALQLENNISNHHLPHRTSTPKSDNQLKNTQNSFYEKSTLIKNYYTFPEEEDSNEQKVIGLVLFYDLADFLLWVHQPIIEIFGDVKKTLTIYKCWDEELYHVVLTVYSGLDDMDELTRLEDKLFQLIDEQQKMDVIGNLLIAQG